MHSREKWRVSEDVACQRYKDRWWICISKNYTIRWWEIDLICEKGKDRVYIEVKCVDYIDDIHWFVTPRKLGRVRKTMEFHALKFPTKKDIRIDVVFVRNGVVDQVYDWVIF